MKLSPKQIAELPTLEEVILNFVDLTVNRKSPLARMAVTI